MGWAIDLPYYRPPSVNDYARKLDTRVRAVGKLVKMLEPWAVPFSPLAIPPATQVRLVRIEHRLGPGERAFDPDNGKKVVLDALVRCRLIRGDAPGDVVCLDPFATRGSPVQGTMIRLDDLPDTWQPGPVDPSLMAADDIDLLIGHLSLVRHQYRRSD
ncbi:MAG: hypothetical protein K2X82_08445 [Gemmataceae bacterium]|nr:hypothetical protein [Gemmataceae bacterium]